MKVPSISHLVSHAYCNAVASNYFLLFVTNSPPPPFIIRHPRSAPFSRMENSPMKRTMKNSLRMPTMNCPPLKVNPKIDFCVCWNQVKMIPHNRFLYSCRNCKLNIKHQRLCIIRSGLIRSVVWIGVQKYWRNIEITHCFRKFPAKLRQFIKNVDLL